MRFYFRTGRRSGVSVGVLGLFIVAPFYAAIVMLWLAVVVLAVLFKALVLFVRRRRGDQRYSPPLP